MSKNRLSFSANKAFYTLLTAFIIALVSLTSLLIKSLPLTIAHAIYVCQKTLSSSITLPHSIPFLLVTITIAVLLVGLISLSIQIIKTRLYLKKNIGKRIIVSELVRKIAQELNLDSKIDIVEDKSQFSFCYGMIRPRICLSTGLVEKLNESELKSVLLHESYHLKNHDPLKIIISKAASYMFFFIPTLRDIQRYYGLSKEISADKIAIQMGGKKSLFSALSKLIILNNPRFAGVAALANIDDLEKRIRFMAEEQDKVSFRPSLPNLALSALVIFFSFVVLTAPVHAISMDDRSMGNSYCVCPYDDRCSKDCQTNFSSKEINFSESRLYTPVEIQIK